jgi:hypothetical protein
VSTIEELLEWKSSGFGLENRDYGSGDPLRWPCDTLYPQNLALTSPTCGGRSVGTVRLRTKTTEFCFLFVVFIRSTAAKKANYMNRVTYIGDVLCTKKR